MGTPNYRPRLADAQLADLMAVFPAVMITGARATGKTTTAMQRAAQIDRLDEPGVAAAYRADPDAALRRARRPLLLDEWQEVPTVLAAVKRAVDASRAPGQFMLTGSVRAELQNETWAGTGRAVRMSMFPLTEREARGAVLPDGPSFIERLATRGIDALALPDEVPDIDGYISRALRGGFPDVVYRALTERQRGLWLASYLDDLVTRDARALDVGKDPTKLRRYVHALALHNAGQPSEATLYRAAGVNAKTAAGYDTLLRNLYVLDLVPAWTHGRIERLVRGGKRYMIDSGLAAIAAGLSANSVLRDGQLVGRYFDAFATAQLRAELGQLHPPAAMHHLRLEGGRREIDLVIELGAGEVLGFEFKAGAAPERSDARHLIWLRDQLGARFAAGAVLHSGPSMFQMDDRIYAIPLCAVWGWACRAAGVRASAGDR